MRGSVQVTTSHNCVRVYLRLILLNLNCNLTFRPNQAEAMADPEESELAGMESEVVFLGFALDECIVHVDSQSAKYLRVVHRTALELATQNRFGIEIGGFWLTTEQIAQLRSLSEYYPLNEAPLVARAIEAYLDGQLATD